MDEEEKPPDTPESELEVIPAATEDEQKYYTCRQVANEFGYSRAYVGRLCMQGRFEDAIRITGGQWKIPAATVEKLRTVGLKPARKAPPSPEPSSKIALDQATVDRIGAAPPFQDAPPLKEATEWPVLPVRKKRIYPLWPLTFIYEEVDEE